MSMTIQSSVKDKILATLSETSKVENALAEMLCDLDQQMEKMADDGKANVVTDALSRKERVKPRRVRAMAMIIQYRVRGMILAAQSEAFKQENIRTERLHGYHSSIWCAPFEALYGRKCRSPVLWAEIEESSLIGPELVQETTDKWISTARHNEYLSSGPPKKVGGKAVHKELGDRMERAATTTSSLEAEHDNEQFWQTTSASTLENGDMEITATIDGKVKVVSEASIRRNLMLEDSNGISTLPTTEIFEQLALMGQEIEVPQLSSLTQTHVADEAASTGVDDRHRGAATTVSSLESGKGRMQPNELMELVTKLSDGVVVLENDLKQTKKTYGATFTKLIKKVKTLEKTIKSSKARRRAQFVVSDDSFNQGRKIVEINEDLDISLVQQMIHHDAQTQGRQEYDLEPNFEFTAPKEVYTDEPDISTANVLVSTAGAKVSTATESLVYIRRSATKRKDKGKAIVEESEPTQTKTKIQQEQESLGFKKLKDYKNNLMKKRGKGLPVAYKRKNETICPTKISTKEEQTSYTGSIKRSAEEELGEESLKRQKIGVGSKPAEESKDKELDRLSQEQLQQLIIIVPEEGMNVEALQTKYPIINWENFNRDDLVKLWDLVRERFSSTEHTDDKERALWVELKNLFEPDTDVLWNYRDICMIH
ncbi:hypothetical protein Tco_0058207 [Tanacetum coccineum]